MAIRWAVNGSVAIGQVHEDAVRPGDDLSHRIAMNDIYPKGERAPAPKISVHDDRRLAAKFGSSATRAGELAPTPSLPTL